MSKFVFTVLFAAIFTTFGWGSGVAAQPNALVKFLNDLDRDVCRSLKTKCKARSKQPAVKRQKSTDKSVAPAKTETSATKSTSAPPIPVQKPAIVPKAAVSAPSKAASAPPIPAQKPVVATETAASVPIPRAKPQALQKQAAILPRVLPRDTLIPSDKIDTCLQKLRAAGADFTIPATNVDSGKCHVENPVNLQSVKAQGNRIKLPEAPLLNCKFALQFSKWLSESGNPILAAQLNSPIEKISTGPGFECRGRNGDGSAKISEHGYGNAVDITTLRMRDGRVINVADSNLLQGFRTSACGYFTTVLGPGSNSAHEKHFHFDLGIHGKSGNYRICE